MFFKRDKAPVDIEDKDPLDTVDWGKKYEVALDIARQEYLLEIERYKSIDEKINKFLVIVSMLMAAAILLINELVKHIDFIEHVHMSSVSIIASVLCLVLLLLTLKLFIQGLWFQNTYRIANVEALINDSSRDNYVQYLHFLIIRYEEVRENNVPITDLRIKKVTMATQYLMWSVICVMILTLELLLFNLLK